MEEAMVNEAGFVKIEMERAASTTALVIDHLRKHAQSTPEMMFVLVMALMEINSMLFASERDEEPGQFHFSFSAMEVQSMAEQLYDLMGGRKVNPLDNKTRTAAAALEHVCSFVVDVPKADDLSIDILELLRERTSGPGEASFVVTRAQLLLMRVAAQRARGKNETEIDYELPPNFVSGVMDRLHGLLGEELMRLREQGTVTEKRVVQ
jgi:hypothetical protein